MLPLVEITKTEFFSNTDYHYDGIWVGATIYVHDIWLLHPIFGEVHDRHFARWHSGDSWNKLKLVANEAARLKETIFAICIGLGPEKTREVIFFGSLGDMRFYFAVSFEGVILRSRTGVVKIVKEWELP